MKKRYAALVTALSMIGSVAGFSAPASAAEPYAWAYSEENYGGKQCKLIPWLWDNSQDCGFVIKSVINRTDEPFCGVDSQFSVHYKFWPNSGKGYEYIGTPFVNGKTLRYMLVLSHDPC